MYMIISVLLKGDNVFCVFLWILDHMLEYITMSIYLSTYLYVCVYIYIMYIALFTVQFSASQIHVFNYFPDY